MEKGKRICFNFPKQFKMYFKVIVYKSLKYKHNNTIKNTIEIWKKQLIKSNGVKIFNYSNSITKILNLEKKTQIPHKQSTQKHICGSVYNILPWLSWHSLVTKPSILGLLRSHGILLVSLDREWIFMCTNSPGYNL